MSLSQGPPSIWIKDISSSAKEAGQHSPGKDFTASSSRWLWVAVAWNLQSESVFLGRSIRLFRIAGSSSLSLHMCSFSFSPSLILPVEIALLQPFFIFLRAHKSNWRHVGRFVLGTLLPFNIVTTLKAETPLFNL